MQCWDWKHFAARIEHRLPNQPIHMKYFDALKNHSPLNFPQKIALCSKTKDFLHHLYPKSEDMISHETVRPMLPLGSWKMIRSINSGWYVIDNIASDDWFSCYTYLVCFVITLLFIHLFRLYIRYPNPRFIFKNHFLVHFC